MEPFSAGAVKELPLSASALVVVDSVESKDNGCGKVF